MKIIAKYIHGSENSTDVDVHYVVDVLPDLNECKKFCSADKAENRNLISINNGIVTDCYKGTIDEINNALLITYNMHHQCYPLLITHKVDRVKPLKFIRAIRIILSHLSRSQYRTQVKLALQGNFKERLDLLMNIDLSTINFSTLNKNMSSNDILKVIAFQIGQTLALNNNIELYTKNSISEYYPELSTFLNRENINAQKINLLTFYLRILINVLKHKEFIEDNNGNITFVKDNITVNLKYECLIK